MYTDEPTFVKDGAGQSRLAGNLMRSAESAYSFSRERTLQRGRDEIWSIMNQLQISGGDGTVNAAHRLYEIAVDRNFTRGRRTSHVAAACLYINCRSNKKPYLLIDFSDHLNISVYVLGAVFLQLCETLRLADHPIIQKLVDPSLFIHRFTDRLLGRSNEAVARTALRIVASMKRDWIQTGRKPSGLCGAALYISLLSHGLNYSKSDVVTVVHVCEATLTKRLIEFENTESGGLTIEEFRTREDDLHAESLQSHLPRPGEVICEHKDDGEPHFALGLCKKCFDELNEISGGLEGGADPPAFQRAERQRMEKEKAQEKIIESCVDEVETEVSKIDSDSTTYESLPSKEHESTGVAAGHQAVDMSSCNEPNELENSADNDPESLSDIDDVEVDGYLHNEEEKRLKKILWEEMNKEYLEEQAAKEAAAAATKEAHKARLGNLSEDNLTEWEQATTGEAVKSKKKRKQRPAEEARNSTPADTPLEATRQMLKRKTFSSRVNYEALEGLYTTDQENVKKHEGKLEAGDANGKQETIKEYDNVSDAGAVDDGVEDVDFAEVGYDPDYEHVGNEDGSYDYDDFDFEEV